MEMCCEHLELAKCAAQPGIHNAIWFIQQSTAVTASSSAMTIHSHPNGCFYPCDLITLCRRIVRRRRYVKQQCKHEGSWSPTTFL